MAQLEPLPLAQLRWACDPDQFDFDTTEDLEVLEEVFGQQRAVDAIHFGVNIHQHGYNLFALGPPGTGKHDVVRTFLEKHAETEETPPDLCYVHNFEAPKEPKTLTVPAGVGEPLREDMIELIADLKAAIPAAFESEDFQTRRQAINEEFQEKQDSAFQEIQQVAEDKDITILRTPSGIALAPVRDGEVIPPGEFDQLDEEEREKVEEQIEEIEERFQDALQEAPSWERERREKLRELSEEVTGYAVGELLNSLRDAYEEHESVVDYLEAVQNDVVENAQWFIRAKQMEAAGPLQQLQQQQQAQGGQPMGGGQQQGPGGPGGDRGEIDFRRYKVNVLVDNSELDGAPVVYEDDPTLEKLTGKVEHIAQFGALMTDFNLIQPGALHNANGGYLMLDARKVLMHQLSWEQLKRSLHSERARIESARQILGLAQTVSLEPEAVDLDVKVVLIGGRRLYYLLSELDPEFDELFKVPADFETDLDREGNVDNFARTIATVAEDEELCRFDCSAVASIVEQTAREADDQKKLSTHMETIKDLLRETDYWARDDGRQKATAEDVQRALDAQDRREGRIRDRMQEQIERDTILIDTDGEVIGQINGLAVLQVGQHRFGKPNRITASVRLGDGEVVDIEREAELGGPIHSKGVLIIAGYLGGRFAENHPLSLTASIVFEQSYGGVEGDSASLAEICTILSSLAEIPIGQNFAVTGSVNQHGRVQAIGGVNEKIEGFFDACKEDGLNGSQGVLIPDSNVEHLMLDREVLDAVEAGDFAVYAVRTVDEAISVLTGVDAGTRDSDGLFPEDSVNGRVQRRLEEFAEKARRFSRGAEDDE